MSLRIYADDHGKQKPQAFRVSIEADTHPASGEPGLFWLAVILVWITILSANLG